MDTKSVEETRLDRIEAELARLRALRPALKNRIDKAEHILTVQLSVANGMRPVRVRCSGSRRSYAVRSNTRLRKTYTVEAGTFRCVCRWAEDGGTGCSHSIAAYVLHRALSGTKEGGRS